MSRSWRVRREQPDVGSLNKYGKQIYKWFETNCPSTPKKCDPFVKDEVLRHCQIQFTMGHYFNGHSGEDSRTECLAVMDKTFREYCKGVKNKVSGCYQFYPTTSAPTTTTVIPSTPKPKSKLPMIIGCTIGGVLVFLVLIILIYCCCTKKKDAVEMVGGSEPSNLGKKDTVTKTKKTSTTTTGTKTTGTKTKSTTWI